MGVSRPEADLCNNAILTLVQLRQKGEIYLGSIGGFDLIFEGEPVREDDYHYETALQRTGVDDSIDLAMTVTPLGAISRLEHALGGFEDEQRRYQNHLDEAKKRLSSYQSRQGGTFVFADELTEKREQLVGLEMALANEATQHAKAS